MVDKQMDFVDDVPINSCTCCELACSMFVYRLRLSQIHSASGGFTSILSLVDPIDASYRVTQLDHYCTSHPRYFS
jgi:hypothetical protein